MLRLSELLPGQDALEITDGVHRLDVIRRHRSLLADGRVARAGHHVAVVDMLNPATLQQVIQRLIHPPEVCTVALEAKKKMMPTASNPLLLPSNLINFSFTIKADFMRPEPLLPERCHDR